MPPHTLKTNPNLLRIFKCYATVLEMLTDRGYTTFQQIADHESYLASPEILTREHILMEDFDTFKKILSTHDNTLDFMTIIAHRSGSGSGSGSGGGRGVPKEKLIVLFCADDMNVRYVNNVILERMRTNGIRHSIVICVRCFQGKTTNQAAKSLKALEPEFTVELFYESELIINISRHEDVPPHIVLTENEKAEVLKAYKAKTSNFPSIKECDPMSRYMGLRCGQMIKILRQSETAGTCPIYRVCIA